MHVFSHIHACVSAMSYKIRSRKMETKEQFLEAKDIVQRLPALSPGPQ